MEDDLQMAWDTALVRAYFETPTKNMTRLVGDFVRKQGLQNFQTFFALDLKRCPKNLRRHWRCTITRYVFAYLPNIHKALTAHGPSKMIDLIIAVNKSNNDTHSAPVDQAKVQMEANVRFNSKVDSFRSKLADGRSADKRESFNRGGQWNVVK